MAAFGTRSALASPDVSGDGRTVEGLVCSYLQTDTYKTKFMRGCFNDALRSGVVPALCWSHDKARILGRMTHWDDRPEGMWMRFRLADPEHVRDAAMARSLLLDNMVGAMSIGFSNGKGRPDPKVRGVVDIYEATIREVSLVLLASVPGSRVLAVRSPRTRDPLPAHIRLALLRRH